MSEQLISKWLKKSTNTFLNFWAGKTNRTTVKEVFLTQFQEVHEIVVPYGTWSFEITTQPDSGNNTFDIIMQGGTIKATARGTSTSADQKIFYFPGVPYVERSDSFGLKNTDNSDMLVVIIFHRIMKANS